MKYEVIIITYFQHYKVQCVYVAIRKCIQLITRGDGSTVH